MWRNTVIIEGFSQDVRKKVENNLSGIASKLKIHLTNRMKHLQVVEESDKAFSKNNCKELTKAEDFQDEAKERLNRVFHSVSNASVAVTFDECLPGYVMFF